LSRDNAIDVTYEVVTSYAVARLDSTLSHSLPRGLSHAARVGPSDMPRLNHISSFDMIGPSKGPLTLSLSSSSLPSSSSSLHLAAAPWRFVISLPYLKRVLPQIDSMSWYPNRVGYIRRLYHLILLYFRNFA
jgi:hypothetical protein